MDIHVPQNSTGMDIHNWNDEILFNAKKSMRWPFEIYYFIILLRKYQINVHLIMIFGPIDSQLYKLPWFDQIYLKKQSISLVSLNPVKSKR